MNPIEKQVYKLTEILKKHQLSVTSARKDIFLIFLENGPLSMSEAEEILGGKVNRATIYRVTELFLKIGVLNKLQIGWKYKLELSDDFVPHHHHLTCRECGKTRELNHARLEKLIAELSAENGYQHSEHLLEISGICPDCSKKHH